MVNLMSEDIPKGNRYEFLNSTPTRYSPYKATLSAQLPHELLEVKCDRQNLIPLITTRIAQNHLSPIVLVKSVF